MYIIYIYVYIYIYIYLSIYIYIREGIYRERCGWINKWKENTQPVSHLHDFQVLLQYWRCHYYLLIWRCLSKYHVDTLNLIVTMVFCEHCKNYRQFTKSTSAEILRISFGDSTGSVETVHRRKISTPGNQKNCSTLRSGSYLCQDLPVSFIQR